MNTISAKDSHLLIRMGISFMQHGDALFVQEAAEWWAVASDDERPQVRSEFSEGIRNYAGTMHRYDEAMQEFDYWCEVYTGVYDKA